MRLEIFLILLTQIIVCSLQKYNKNEESSKILRDTRVNREVIENGEEDSNIINLKVLNNIVSHSGSSQQPFKRSSDKKPVTSKKKSRKAKDTRKMRSTTSRVDEDTEAEQNESTTIAAEARRSMQPEEEESNGSEESRNPKKEDAESLDEDIDNATGKSVDPDADSKSRMGNLLKKTEKIVKIKESFEENNEGSRKANIEMERTNIMNMEDKLDQLISKLLKETEEANMRGSTVAPSEATVRNFHPYPVHQLGPRPAVHNRCADTFGSLCYNPLQQLISQLDAQHPMIPRLVRDYPRRVVMQPPYGSVIYH